MDLDKILEKNTFRNGKINGHEIMEVMLENALNHTDYERIPEDLLKRRPNESEATFEFIKGNYLRLSHEVPDNWLTKSVRIFNHNSFNLLSLSERLKSRLDKKDIFPSDWVAYVRQVIYPQSIVNPNQLFTFLPFHPNDKKLNPYEHLPKNEHVGLAPTLIPFDKIKVYRPDSLLFFEADTVTKLGDTNHKNYWAKDKDNWYILKPYKAENNTVKYKKHIWYEHEFGKIMAIWLPGRMFTNSEGNVYRKSYISSAFEHLKEFVGLKKDDSSITLLHAYPHFYIGDLDCPDCEGSRTDTDGVTCKSCNGSGKMTKPNPEQATVIPRTTSIDEGGYPNPFMGWAFPGVSILEQMDKKLAQCFRSAFLSIGLRPFTDMTESGEAKKYRLEDLQDRLEEVANGVHHFAVSMFEIIEYYVKCGAGEKDNIEAVRISKPKSYQALNREELSILMESNNRMLRNEYFRQVYIDKVGYSLINDKIVDLVLSYAPLINMKQEEIDMFISNGAFDRNDLVKSIYAFKVFEKLAAENKLNGLEQDYSELFAEADILLKEWGVLKVSLENAIN